MIRLSSGAPRACELKFLVTEQLAVEIDQRMRDMLAQDSHSDPALGNAYHTTTIYCDTTGFDVARKIGTHRRRKYRVRRYGMERGVYLERKSKNGIFVRKRRSSISQTELAILGEVLADGAWPGDWFHRQITSRALHPVCRMAYDRTALVGLDAAGPLRVTFDRGVRGELMSGWSFEGAVVGPTLLDGFVICEFKYRDALPAFFKDAIAELRLAPQTISKYRLLMETTGQLPAASHSNGRPVANA